MALVINTNVSSLTSQRLLNNTQMSLQKSMERLSSGLRINSAADDAAGLAISDRMTSQIRGMTVSARNANDGISMVQTADGAMASITDTMQRMRDLAVQASNYGSVTSSDRQKLQTEFKQLGDEVNRIIQNTQFNGKSILNGSMSGAVFQVGANITQDNRISVTVSNLATTSGIQSLLGTGLSIGSNATQANGVISKAISALDLALKKIDTFRATLGAVQNRFSTTIANLNSSIENQSAARSRIMDADFASETSSLSRSNILQQAGTAMLAQANTSQQGVLSLLR